MAHREGTIVPHRKGTDVPHREQTDTPCREGNKDRLQTPNPRVTGGFVLSIPNIFSVSPAYLPTACQKHSRAVELARAAEL